MRYGEEKDAKTPLSSHWQFANVVRKVLRGPLNTLAAANFPIVEQSRVSG
jgi:hypothetical protein